MRWRWSACCREDTVGEDLELTWRVHFAGYDVEFAPHAKVLAEVPSSVRGLWKQRVRWQRGLIQTARLHRRRVWRTPRRPIGAYLPWNLFSMLVVPVLQLVALPLAVAAMAVGALPVGGPVEVALWLGLGLALGVTLLSIALDRSWRDLRLLWALPLWVPLSVMMSAVTLTALWHEARGTQAAWNKLERTGVQTVPLPT